MGGRAQKDLQFARRVDREVLVGIGVDDAPCPQVVYYAFTGL